MNLQDSKLKNKEYLDNVREMSCVACYFTNPKFREGSEAHHEVLSHEFRHYPRMNDYTAVPLCRRHHTIRHDSYGMLDFWRAITTEPFAGFYTAFHLFIRFAAVEKLTLPQEFIAMTQTGDYSRVDSLLKLRLLTDKISTIIHTQYYTGNTLFAFPLELD